MRTTRTLAAALLFLLPLACGDDDAGQGSGDTSDTGGTGDTGDTGDDPATPVDGEPGGAEGGLFIEVAFVGGFVPAGFGFRNPPGVVVYEDGTVIAPGAVAAIFPGPAALPLFEGRVDDDVLDDLLRAAADAGMVGGTPDVGDAGNLPIADAPTTRVTVVVDGDERVVEAYALIEAAGADLGGSGLTDAQIAARAALADLVSEASNAATPQASSPFDVDRYRVLAGPPPENAELPQSEVPWPEGLPEPVDGVCVAITGDAARTLTDALQHANEQTPWRLGDRVFSLAIRPVLPHEPDCPDDAGS